MGGDYLVNPCCFAVDTPSLANRGAAKLLLQAIKALHTALRDELDELRQTDREAA